MLAAVAPQQQVCLEAVALRQLRLARAEGGVAVTNDNDLYDLESVYGYSGYLCNTNNKSFLEDSFKKMVEYYKEKMFLRLFGNYCYLLLSLKVLTNFLSFH